jgi:hypothetical protein
VKVREPTSTHARSARAEPEQLVLFKQRDRRVAGASGEWRVASGEWRVASGEWVNDGR